MKLSTSALPLASIAFLLSVSLSTHASPLIGNYAPEQHLQFALEEQSHRNYRSMLHHLRIAAQAGLVEAQETLGMALIAGQSVYGPAVRTDSCEALKWFIAAARSGSELGVQQVHFLNRARNAPGFKACKRE